MRKLFPIFVLILTLISCVNNEDEYIKEKEAAYDGTRYNVTFDLLNFKLKETPLRTSSWPTQYICKYIVYKASGEVYLQGETNNSASEVSESELKLTLPKGNYIVVFMALQKQERELVFSISNFFNDFCQGRSWPTLPQDNRGIYYETKSLAVTGNITKPIPVELLPMGSTIDVTVKDADVCTLPEGTEYVLCVAEPHTYGFYFKDKRPYSSYTSTPIQSVNPGQTIAEFRKTKTVNNLNIASSQGVAVSLIYWGLGEDKQPKELGKKVIYKGDIDAGKLVHFSGNIGIEEGTPVFDFSIKPMIDESITFE